MYVFMLSRVFFFNDTATTEIYTLSLHDALPICRGQERDEHRQQHPRQRGEDLLVGHPALLLGRREGGAGGGPDGGGAAHLRDRKSTRLNSSHANISYAVFCLKKKKNHVM